jgi:hypothetical protein
VRANTFIGCANGGNIFHTFSNGGGSFTADFGFVNYTVENNVFTQSCNNRPPGPCGGRLDGASGFGHCNIYSGADFTNVRIRFNTFLGGSGFDMAIPCQPAVGGVTLVGNLRNGSSAACSTGWSTPPVMRYELYHTFGALCSGLGNLNIGGLLTFVANNSNTAPDPHLTGLINLAENRVPVSAGCPLHDIDGQPRPVSGFCDAGADER